MYFRTAPKNLTFAFFVFCLTSFEFLKNFYNQYRQKTRIVTYFPLRR